VVFFTSDAEAEFKQCQQGVTPNLILDDATGAPRWRGQQRSTISIPRPESRRALVCIQVIHNILCLV
jgi:hypothetical protein